MLATTPAVSRLLRCLGESFLGGRLLFHLLLRPLTQRSLQVRSACCLLPGTSPANIHTQLGSCLVQELRMGPCSINSYLPARRQLA